MGVSADEMGGCIFDQGYLNIGPNPVPTPSPATEGVVLNKLERPLLNTNTHQILDPKNPSGEALPKTPTDNPIKEKPGTSDIKTNGNNNNTIVKPSQPIEIKVPTIINKPVPINTNKPNNTSPVTPIKNGKPGKG
jgi:hypothetical protein